MKRILTTACAALCIVIAAGNNALAQSARARIPETPIRAEANPTSATLATLGEGDPVDVIDAHGAWYRVLVPGTESKPRVGYVMAPLIELANGNGSAQRVTQPSIPPTAAQLQQAAAQQQQRAKEQAREEALKAEVDRLNARVAALQAAPATQVVEPPDTMRLAGSHPQSREGMWFNAGGGLGTLSCVDCTAPSVNGFSGGVSFGWTLTDRLLLGIGTTGFYRSGFDLSAGSMADARLRFYPKRESGFFITGGLGFGSVASSDNAELGASAVFGLGWDLRVANNVSLTPFWSTVGVATSTFNLGVGQLGLGVTIH